MNGRFTIWAYMSAVMITPVAVFIVINWYENKYQSLPILSPGISGIECFTMHNQHDNEITDKDFRNKILVVDFFFTHCPSICPKITENLKLVQKSFEDDSSVWINSFSIDPERDSVGRLAVFASKFQIDGRWNLLTGDKRAIYRLARNSFMVDATEGDGGPNDFIHSDRLVLVDQLGRLRGFYKGTDHEEVIQLIAHIQKLKKESLNGEVR